jgi:hypothetical protein
MDWNCTLTEERLSDLLDASLLPDEAAAYSAHAAGCARCAKLVAQVGGLVTRMQRSALVEEPPELVGKILDATLGPRKQTRVSPGWSGWLSAIWQPRFAMGLVTAAASLVIVAHALGSAAGKSRLSSQPESFSEPISVPAAKPSLKPEPGQEQQQPSNDPHEKSQTVPHSIRRDARAVVELAVMLPDSFSENWQTGALRRNP